MQAFTALLETCEESGDCSAYRPAYLELGSLRSKFPNVPIIAVTATATPAVQQCIIDSLKLRDCLLLKDSFNRHNLQFEVRHKELIGDGTDEASIQVASVFNSL